MESLITWYDSAEVKRTSAVEAVSGGPAFLHNKSPTIWGLYWGSCRLEYLSDLYIYVYSCVCINVHIHRYMRMKAVTTSARL